MPRLLKLASLGLTENDWQQFHLMGDINKDGYINDADADILMAAFMSKPGDPNWNPNADLDRDGEVGVNDVLILGNNYPLDIWTWKGIAVTPTVNVPALIGVGIALAILLFLI